MNCVFFLLFSLFGWAEIGHCVLSKEKCEYITRLIYSFQNEKRKFHNYSYRLAIMLIIFVFRP